MRTSVHLASLLLVLCGIVSLNGFNLQCTFHLAQWPFIGTGEGCRVSNLHITSRGQIVTSVNGENLNSFRKFHFKTLFIKNQTVHFLPQGLGDFFPDLEGLWVHSSSLKEVNKEDLSQFPNLVELTLNNGDLQVLPSDLFEGNPEVLLIGFYENKLTHVGRGILTPMKKLMEANFQNNTCIHQYAKKQSDFPLLVTALEANCPNDTISEELEKNKYSNTPTRR